MNFQLKELLHDNVLSLYNKTYGIEVLLFMEKGLTTEESRYPRVHNVGQTERPVRVQGQGRRTHVGSVPTCKLLSLRGDDC